VTAWDAGWDRGFAAGVAAAREAVAAFDVKANNPHGAVMFVRDALAAIDALPGWVAES
jgi:hypothetical protein